MRVIKQKKGLPRWRSGKESTCRCWRHKRCKLDPWVGKIPCSWKWQPTTVFLSGKFHGQRSLAGYSPWGCKKSDTTEHHALSKRSQSAKAMYYVRFQLYDILVAAGIMEGDGKVEGGWGLTLVGGWRDRAQKICENTYSIILIAVKILSMMP